MTGIPLWTHCTHVISSWNCLPDAGGAWSTAQVASEKADGDGWRNISYLEPPWKTWLQMVTLPKFYMGLALSICCDAGRSLHFLFHPKGLKYQRSILQNPNCQPTDPPCFQFSEGQCNQLIHLKALTQWGWWDGGDCSRCCPGCPCCRAVNGSAADIWQAMMRVGSPSHPSWSGLTWSGAEMRKEYLDYIVTMIACHLPRQIASNNEQLE